MHCIVVWRKHMHIFIISFKFNGLDKLINLFLIVHL
jgi:hypothetical protein